MWRRRQTLTNTSQLPASEGNQRDHDTSVIEGHRFIKDRPPVWDMIIWLLLITVFAIIIWHGCA